MRKDMKRVIIDVGRRDAWYWTRARTTSRAARARERALLRRDPDLAPWKQGIGQRADGGTRFPADRTRPLFRWLVKQAGRRWDDVWSEICADNDARSIDGWHLRAHARALISFPSDLERIPWISHPFLVDEQGVLRHDPAPEPAPYPWLHAARPAPSLGPTDTACVQESDTRQYWRLEGLWYAFDKDTSPELHLWDPRRGQRVRKCLSPDDPRRWRKRRLSNADVQRLRLERRARPYRLSRRRGAGG
jgi:hypothetical protein